MKINLISENQTKHPEVKILWTKGENVSGYKSIYDVGNEFLVKETGNVNSLLVENLSANYIIVTDGDILIGGKQNRSPKYSFIIAPGQEMEIPVYCVERDRWHYSDYYDHYDHQNERSLRRYIYNVKERLERIEGLLRENRHFFLEELLRLSDEFYWISKELREAYRRNDIRSIRKSREKFGFHEMTMTYTTRMSKVYDNQHRVWETIERELNELGKRNRTSDFSKIFEGFREENLEVPEEATGFIITYNSIPIIYESINNPNVFNKYANKLINSFLLKPFRPRREISLETFIEEIQEFNTDNKEPVYRDSLNKFYQSENFKLLKHKEFGNAHFLYLNN